MNTRINATTNTELDRLISWIRTPEGNLKALSVFTSLSSGLSVRSGHILESIYGGERPTKKFLIRMLSISGKQLMTIPTCGRKSVEELLKFQDSYRSILYQALPEEVVVEDRGASEAPTEPADIQMLLPEIQGLSEGFSTRSRNAVALLVKNAGYNVEQLYKNITKSSFSVQSMSNVGRKSYGEVTSWCEEVRELVESHLPVDCPFLGSNEEFPRNVVRELPDFIDCLHPVLQKEASSLSINSRKPIIFLYESCGQSVIRLYNKVTGPGFKVSKLPNIGIDSIVEITTFLQAFIRIVEKCAVLTTEEEVNHLVSDLLLSPLIENSDVRKEVIDLQDNLGYLPFFKLTELVMATSFSGRERTILDGCIMYREGQRMRVIDEVAKELGITSERVRQLRSKILDKLPDIFKTVKNIFPEAKLAYDPMMSPVNIEINAKERTSFSLDFTHWIIGIVFNEYRWRGKPEQVFTHIGANAGFIALIPASLTKVFSFRAFMLDIEDRIQQRRKDDETLSLRTLIEAHHTSPGYKDVYEEIESACRSIILLHYPLEMDFEGVTFRANAYKPLSDIAYDLISANKAPMTSGQLVDAISALYPDRHYQATSICAAALRHPEVIAIGRKGAYTLKEWTLGPERGGTIRQFVSEFLDTKPMPVARIDEVANYVRIFRPNSSDASITSNLSQEKNHKFVILLKDGVRYVGYSGVDYGKEYSILIGDGGKSNRRTTEESMRLLEEFILANGRYPGWSQDDKDENRLRHFVQNRRYAADHGLLSKDDTDRWRTFEAKYNESNNLVKP